MTTKAGASYPTHIAIIMDGNRRWAKQHGTSTIAGHKAGIQAIHTLIKTAKKLDISHITLFAFSSENWQRDKTDVSNLMKLMSSALATESKKLLEQKVCLQVIGNTARFSKKIRQQLSELTHKSAANQDLTLSIAMNYGGRWDIAHAAKLLVADVQAGIVAADDINEDLLDSYMCLADMPAVDLLIRPGGEKRISNFLLWQVAYAELYFTDTLWPDFASADLLKAIEWFSKRERRFGT
jgi:undecaprenyl diphosphate synthase